MRAISRRVTATLTVVLAAAITAGCASAAGAPTGSAASGLEKTDLSVAVVPAVDSAGFFIALYDGLFKAQGLNVNFIPAVSSETELADQVKGTVDITGGNYVSYIQAQQSGIANMEIVAEGSVMDQGAQALYTMPDSKIRTLADLRGKTIGINAPRNILYLLAASALTADGISADSVHFAAVPLPQMAAALAAGKIQAAVLPEPFASQAQQQYGVVTLADLDTGATTDFPVQGYVVTRQWAAAYPHTLAAFLRALEAGQQLADTNRGEAEHAMESLPMNPVPLGVSPQTAAIMALDTYPVGPVDTVRIQRVADVMSQFLSFPAFSVDSMVGR
jgi:NitT/TauT family transport system substrate-binding protein